jgi:hypothetical protein
MTRGRDQGSREDVLLAAQALALHVIPLTRNSFET